MLESYVGKNTLIQSMNFYNGETIIVERRKDRKPESMTVDKRDSLIDTYMVCRRRSLAVMIIFQPPQHPKPRLRMFLMPAKRNNRFPIHLSQLVWVHFFKLRNQWRRNSEFTP